MIPLLRQVIHRNFLQPFYSSSNWVAICQQMSYKDLRPTQGLVLTVLLRPLMPSLVLLAKLRMSSANAPMLSCWPPMFTEHAADLLSDRAAEQACFHLLSCIFHAATPPAWDAYGVHDSRVHIYWTIQPACMSRNGLLTSRCCPISSLKVAGALDDESVAMSSCVSASWSCFQAEHRTGCEERCSVCFSKGNLRRSRCLWPQQSGSGPAPCELATATASGPA